MTVTRVKILIAVSILAVVSLTYGILAPPPRGGSQVSASGERHSPQAVSSAAPVRHMFAAERLFRKGEHNTWGVNPFAKKKLPRSDFENLVLNGIAWDVNHPTAIINDQVVTVGDKIGEASVAAMDPMGVTLQQGDKELRLTLDKEMTGEERSS